MGGGGAVVDFGGVDGGAGSSLIARIGTELQTGEHVEDIDVGVDVTVGSVGAVVTDVQHTAALGRGEFHLTVTVVQHLLGEFRRIAAHHILGAVEGDIIIDAVAGTVYRRARSLQVVGDIGKEVIADILIGAVAEGVLHLGCQSAVIVEM